MKLNYIFVLFHYIYAIESIKDKLIRKGENNFRQLSSGAICESGTKVFVHYFEVDIFIEPDTSEVCSIPDQVKLGNDINAILSSESIADVVVNDDVAFDAKVCPKPSTPLRRQLAAKTAFVYRGGGGCRGCTTDNRDSRRVLQAIAFGSNEWFEDIYAVYLEIKLRSTIQLIVGPKNIKCMGLLPKIHVEINKISFSELQPRVRCEIGTPTPSLASMSQTIIGPIQECSGCRSIDFSASSDGTPLRNGKIISQEWKSFGVTVIAGSYPLFEQETLRPRIFDTGNSTCIQGTKTQMLGSPNKLCPVAGPGEGEGGAPGQVGENCNTIGNVLIVQDLKTVGECPVPYSNGTGIIFEFDSPVYFQDIGVMNAVGTSASLEVTYADEVMESIPIHAFGNNSLQRVIIDKANVIRSKLNVVKGFVAVSEINFCMVCTAIGTNVNSQECIGFEKGNTNSVKIIEIDNFESENTEESLQGWTNGIILYDGPTNFTKFLGLKNGNVDSLLKNFSVPSDAADILLEMDFYQIGNWSISDSISIFVDGELISMTLSLNQSKVEWNGKTSLGILWNSTRFSTVGSTLNSFPYVEQRYRIKIQVPASSQLYYDGNLRLVLRIFATEGGNMLSGWDNIQLSARYNCEELNSKSQKSFSGSPLTATPTSNTMSPPSNILNTILTSNLAKFPTSTPTISPTQKVEPVSKSATLVTLPPILQISTQLSFDTPTAKPSTVISTAAPTSVATSKVTTANNLFQNLFVEKTTTNSPTTK